MSVCHHQYCYVKRVPAQHSKELSPCHGTQEQRLFPERPFCGDQEASHYYLSLNSSKVQNVVLKINKFWEINKGEKKKIQLLRLEWLVAGALKL